MAYFPGYQIIGHRRDSRYLCQIGLQIYAVVIMSMGEVRIERHASACTYMEQFAATGYFSRPSSCP